MNDNINFDIDYQFIGNAATAHMQMIGLLKENQHLIVDDLVLDKDNETLNVTCTVIEEIVN